MSYQVRFTEEAEAELVRLYESILAKDQSDWSLATRALEAIKMASGVWNSRHSATGKRLRTTLSCGS